MNAVRATFPRDVRLKGAAQFTGAFQRRYRSENFLLLARSGGSKRGSARLGIVIGRKQRARAVDRARLRRNDLGNVDLIVKYRGHSSKRIDSTIQKELMGLLERTAT